jgi:hypothetical protein
MPNLTQILEAISVGGDFFTSVVEGFARPTTRPIHRRADHETLRYG